MIFLNVCKKKFFYLRAKDMLDYLHPFYLDKNNFLILKYCNLEYENSNSSANTLCWSISLTNMTHLIFCIGTGQVWASISLNTTK